MKKEKKIFRLKLKKSLPHCNVKYKQSEDEMRVININILVSTGETKFPRWEDYQWGWWVVFILNVSLWGSDSKWRQCDLKINKNLRQAGSWSEQLLVLTPSSGPGLTQVNPAEAGPDRDGRDRYLTIWLTNWWNIFTSSNHKSKNRIKTGQRERMTF